VNKNNFFILSLFLHSSIIPNNPILLTSIPKCGTHLLEKTIKLIFKIKEYGNIERINAPRWTEFHKEDLEKSQAGGGIVLGHFTPGQNEIDLVRQYNAKVFFIYRDPRDQIISSCYHEATLYNRPQPTEATVGKLITKRIAVGGYKKLIPWKNVPGVCTVRFEDLVGPQGSGSSNAQYESIEKIANHLDMPLNSEQITAVARELFGGTATFNKGELGKWKRYFTEKHKELFKQHAGQLLIDLGYEDDMEW